MGFFVVAAILLGLMAGRSRQLEPAVPALDTPPESETGPTPQAQCIPPGLARRRRRLGL